VFDASKSVEWIDQRSTMKKFKLSGKIILPHKTPISKNSNPAISTQWILMNQKVAHSE
jgi:hypothetical protein